VLNYVARPAGHFDDGGVRLGNGEFDVVFFSHAGF
jgi:hypothetical protein